MRIDFVQLQIRIVWEEGANQPASDGTAPAMNPLHLAPSCTVSCLMLCKDGEEGCVGEGPLKRGPSKEGVGSGEDEQGRIGEG
jgi:hypothetical protein